MQPSSENSIVDHEILNDKQSSNEIPPEVAKGSESPLPEAERKIQASSEKSIVNHEILNGKQSSDEIPLEVLEDRPSDHQSDPLRKYLTNPKIDCIGSEKEHKCTLGVFNYPHYIKYGAFDIHLHETGPAAYRVFYLSIDKSHDLSEIRGKIEAASATEFSPTLLSTQLEELNTPKAKFYRTKVLDEMDSPVGLTIDEMERQIHYSGLENYIKNNFFDLEKWSKNEKDVFFIVPSEGVDIKDYLLEKEACPEAIQIRFANESRKYTFSWGNSIHDIGIIKINNIFGHKDKMALNIDFTVNGTDNVPNTKDPYDSLISYENTYGRVYEATNHDGLTFFHNSFEGYTLNVLSKLKEQGLKGAFEFHYQNSFIGFRNIRILLMGDKEKLKLYTKLEANDNFVEL